MVMEATPHTGGEQPRECGRGSAIRLTAMRAEVRRRMCLKIVLEYIEQFSKVINGAKI